MSNKKVNTLTDGARGAGRSITIGEKVSRETKHTADRVVAAAKQREKNEKGQPLPSNTIAGDADKELENKNNADPIVSSDPVGDNRTENPGEQNGVLAVVQEAIAPALVETDPNPIAWTGMTSVPGEKKEQADPLLEERVKNLKEVGADLTNQERENIKTAIRTELAKENPNLVYVDKTQLAQLVSDKRALEADVKTVLDFLNKLLGDDGKLGAWEAVATLTKVMANPAQLAPLVEIFERNKNLIDGL